MVDADNPPSQISDLFGTNAEGRLCGAILDAETAVNAGSHDPDTAELDSIVPILPTSQFYSPQLFAMVSLVFRVLRFPTALLPLRCSASIVALPAAAHAMFQVCSSTSLKPIDRLLLHPLLQVSAAQQWTESTLTVTDAHGGTNQCSERVNIQDVSHVLKLTLLQRFVMHHTPLQITCWPCC